MDYEKIYEGHNDFSGIVQCIYCKHIWYSQKLPHPIRCPNCKKWLCNSRAKKEAKKKISGGPYCHKYMYVWLEHDIVGTKKSMKEILKRIEELKEVKKNV